MPGRFNTLLLSLIFLLSCISANAAEAVKPEGAMNNTRLDTLIKRIDNKAEGRPGYWRFTVEGVSVTVITDEKADRMRIMAPVIPAGKLDPEALTRLLQANFDTALDARYAIAKGVLWSAYIHPLSPLQNKEFLEGLGQVVNLNETFGSSYSSGSLMFQGGDSKGLQRRKLIDDLLKKGLSV